jgi:hypothetical protein
MQAYQFEQYVSPSHRVSVELPENAPTGSAKIIVLFPDQVATPEASKPRFANMAEFHKWLITQPPTGRTVEEIDQQIREERDSWN